MADHVRWGSDLAAGLQRAHREGLPVLLEFYTYGCEGCARLDRETYTNPKVIATLNREFVPVSLNADAAPEQAQEFDAVWTPVLLALDPRGKVQYRFEGFLPPEEFVPLLLTAKLVTCFRLRRHGEVRDMAHRMQIEYPASRFMPEALYYLGASLQVSGDHDGSQVIWRQLRRAHSQSLWALRLPWPESGRAVA